MKACNVAKNEANTFTFKEILYKVKTCSRDSKTFKSIYYTQIFSMSDSGSRL